MRKSLVLLIGDFNQTEKVFGEVLAEWTAAGILDSVAWMTPNANASSSQVVQVGAKTSVVTQDLFELLTSRIWSHVTVIAVRQAELDKYDESRFHEETRIMNMVEEAFAVHRDLHFRSATVSVASSQGLVENAFDPRWNLHILQEPMMRIDTAVASQPMEEEHRPLLLALLALTISGGFTWQFNPLLDELSDPTIGNEKPIRVGRAFVRVVSAGRLTDEILAGAFPASGPWSVPPDVTNGRAVPPGTVVPENVITEVRKLGNFNYERWVSTTKRSASKISIMDGIKLFFKEFWAALKGIPLSFVSMVKREVEEFVQRATFGSNSTILLKFDPSETTLDTSEAIEAIRSLNLGGEVDPVGDSQAWMVLQQTALSCVDGGRLPANVPAPMSGTNRLVFTDPSAIGPAPSDEPFTVGAFERALLHLDDMPEEVGPMDIENGHLLHLRLADLRKKMEAGAAPVASQASQAPSSSPEQTKEPAKAQKAEKTKKVKKKKSGSKGKFKKLNFISALIAKIRKKKSVTEKTPTTTPESTTSNESSNVTTDGKTESTESTASESSSTSAETTPSTSAKESDLTRHSPKSKAFKASEYVFIGSFYQGEREDFQSDYQAENEKYQAALKQYSPVNGYWKLNKSCDHRGTTFDHGLIYLHEPTSEIVHLGHVCAKKSFPIQDQQDLISRRLAELEKRWAQWLSIRQGSFLWRIGISILQGTISAREDLSRALQILESTPQAQQMETEARKKFAKWTRRGMLSFVIIAALSVASVIFTPLPLLLFVLLTSSYFSGLVIRLILLARDVVRAQYRMLTAMDEYERMYNIARQAVNEIVRLSSVQDQFADWQEIIREVVHVPFGREVSTVGAGKELEEVRRPPALVLGKSNPDTQQKMQLLLSARRQTIHAGWLTEIMDVLKEEWKAEYSNVRLTGPGDNILPEADNAPAGSVVGKKPLSDENVYYPRTDFRNGVSSGLLQKKLVEKKSEQIAEDLRRTPIDQLLGQVEVSGLGSALSGLPVREFLDGLSVKPLEPVNFPPDLISDNFPQNRIFGPEVTLPPFGEMNASTGQIRVESGVELTAATWRVELSGHLHPHAVLRGFNQAVSSTSIIDDEPGDGLVIP